ncbi:hypothetical protein NM688_g382 [Phlebia brevispora]|uniref:Uncharacterized protein n=1 Tax=Phlebia brevispora TaxID=194682 RepID=A0ACC1TEH6_9APHY|nr:hypothetical protein NM688_g382 [Phlebia brevispora]
MGKTAKRKTSSSSAAPRKKAKTEHLSVDDLPWKVVSHKQEAGLHTALEGVMELEEVDGVEVVYEETEAGKVAKFNVCTHFAAAGLANLNSVQVVENAPHGRGAAKDSLHGPSTVSESETEEDVEDGFDSKSLLPNWHGFSLHSRLLRSLHSQGFTTPTPIQSRALPAASKGKDVVGVAETGSGKTLAYGLPILNCLLNEVSASKKLREPQTRRPVRALILAPTRELAFQVSSHLNTCLNFMDALTVAVKQEDVESTDVLKAQDPKEDSDWKKLRKGKGKSNTIARAGTSVPPRSRRPPPVSVAAIVGGMSAQKQRRILSRGIDVLVATPGRLWDILQEVDDTLASQIKQLRFLVLDEADRMIETGHFAELENILRLTLRQAKEDEIEPDSHSETVESPLEENTEDPADNLQTFVYSATLSKDLQRNLRKRSRPQTRRKSKAASTLDDLLLRLDFRDAEPEIVDLSPEGGVVSTLTESQIGCLSGDKDAYLYYFLLRYPGRSLVFLSSIDGIRRLVPLLELLGLKAFPLHSQLEQRQRLKNLDRFKSVPNAILLATDIAARGLDIPSVDHVIHYQIPRSADVYVHRNGRTARAMRSGFSLLMCAPDERRIVKALLGSLGRQQEDIPEMSVELYLLDKLKARIQLARQIDSTQHKIKKQNHENNWLRQAAESMEIELDSDLAPSSDDEDRRGVPSKRQTKNLAAKTNALKEELRVLLAQPLIARGVSTRYITSGSKPIVDNIIAGENHETMVGLPKSVAVSDVAPAKRKKSTKQEEYEEWTGFDAGAQT